MNRSTLMKKDTPKKEWDKAMYVHEDLNKLYRINRNKKEIAEGERIGDYEMKGLYKIFFELAGEVYNANIKPLNLAERLEYLFERFNEMLMEDIGNNINSNNYIFKNSIMIDKSFFDGLFLSDEDASLGKHFVERFINASSKIKKNPFPKRQYFRYSAVEEYLNTYLDLCRFVFKPNCVYQEELRSLRIIEDLLNIDYCEEKKCFGIYSPFIVFSILRTLKYIASLPDEISNTDLSYECAKLLNSRKHIIATYAIRSFSRFTIMDEKSYVVEYSRRKNQITCKNIGTVSSIDNIKPIRLFEKITSHIYTTFKETPFINKKDFTISVYGFCSYDKKIGSAEIEDLIYEIFSWFEDKHLTDPYLKNKVIENLQIDYYLITKESPKNNGDENAKFKYIYVEKDSQRNETIYNCNLSISPFPYKHYNNHHLNKTIQNSDIVFILDCPWLASEEFSLANEGNISSYSQWVNQASFKDDLELNSANTFEKNSFFNRSHLFASINDQFNRLAVDSMAKYGKVVRVMKDYMLRWIQSQIQEYQKQNIYKTVYVYNSSLRGMSYSDYADYPIIREETYSNKRFSIMRFSTRDNQCVRLNNEKSIYISLWNIIKYVDVSFVYNGLKEYFSTYLYDFMIVNESAPVNSITEDKQKKIKRDIISIMRNIIFVVKYAESNQDVLTNVTVDMILSKPVRQTYLEKTGSNDHFNNYVNNLFRFFKNIIENVLFKNSNGLGDNCIRDAFEKSLYNQSKSINDIFFLHMYSMKRNANSLSKFNIVVENKLKGYNEKTDNDKIDSLVPNFDAFSDKRAYQKLFNYLDMPKCPMISINSVLNQVDRIFKDKSTSRLHSKDILRNIREICEDFDYTKSFLYENLNMFK